LEGLAVGTAGHEPVVTSAPGDIGLERFSISLRESSLALASPPQTLPQRLPECIAEGICGDVSGDVCSDGLL
jgi:hypothetical protein